MNMNLNGSDGQITRRLHVAMPRQVWLSVFALLAPVCFAQTLAGTMTVVTPPSNQPLDEALAEHELGLRRMGVSEEHVDEGRAAARVWLARQLAGMRASGSFRFAFSDDATSFEYVRPTPIRDNGSFIGFENYDGAATVSFNGATVTIMAGDRRVFQPTFWASLLLGRVPQGASLRRDEAGDGGWVREHTWVQDDIIHSLTTTWKDRDAALPSKVEFGYRTPEQYARAGRPARMVVLLGTRQATDEIVVQQLGPSGLIETTELAISDREPEGATALDRGMKVGMSVVDMRLGQASPVNYVFAGSFPDASALQSPVSPSPRPKGESSPVFVIAGLGCLGAALAIFVRRRRVR
jgi:hypothetical protein